jgi:hypothetical protein
MNPDSLIVRERDNPPSGEYRYVLHPNDFSIAGGISHHPFPIGRDTVQRVLLGRERRCKGTFCVSPQCPRHAKFRLNILDTCISAP